MYHFQLPLGNFNNAYDTNIAVVAPNTVTIETGEDLDKLSPGKDKKFYIKVPVVEYRSIVVTAKTSKQAVEKASREAARRYKRNNYYPLAGFIPGKMLCNSVEILYEHEKNFKAKVTQISYTNYLGQPATRSQYNLPDIHRLTFQHQPLNIEL